MAINPVTVRCLFFISFSETDNKRTIPSSKLLLCSQYMFALWHLNIELQSIWYLIQEDFFFY